MIAYLDSSVLLRLVLGEPGRLREWNRLEKGVAGALAEVECLRTLDRISLLGTMRPQDLAVRREGVYRLLDALEIIEISPAILSRAAQPFSTPLGTLDAIHLSSALAYREARESSLVMATHDEMLAVGARACGMAVIGTA